MQRIASNLHFMRRNKANTPFCRSSFPIARQYSLPHHLTAFPPCCCIYFYTNVITTNRVEFFFAFLFFFILFFVFVNFSPAAHTLFVSNKYTQKSNSNNANRYFRMVVHVVGRVSDLRRVALKCSNTVQFRGEPHVGHWKSSQFSAPVQYFICNALHSSLSSRSTSSAAYILYILVCMYVYETTTIANAGSRLYRTVIILAHAPTDKIKSCCEFPTIFLATDLYEVQKKKEMLHKFCSNLFIYIYKTIYIYLCVCVCYLLFRLQAYTSNS